MDASIPGLEKLVATWERLHVRTMCAVGPRGLCPKIDADSPMISPRGMGGRGRSQQSAGMCAMSVVLMIMGALMSGTAQAEDLEQGKSGAKLFAANCAHCHRSPRGLAKDRVSWTLSRFLQQHYTSGSASAQTLTAFLQSVDTRAGSQPTVRNTRPPGTSTSEPALRPRAPVPAR